MRTILFGTAVLAAASLAGPALAQTVVTPHARSAVSMSTSSSYLGIGVQDIDADRAKTLKLKEVRGAEVTNVNENSPAAKAGFKEGDVILDYNGQSVEGREQLARMVQETPAGRQVKIGVWRNGAPQSLTATIEAGSGRAFSFDGNSFVMPEVHIPPMPPIDMPRMQTIYRNPALGIFGESLGEKEQLAEYFGVKDGVLVTEVFKDSAAEKAGIKAGDVITKVDDAKVSSPRDITNTLRSSHSKKTFNVTVIRNKKEMSLPVTIEAASNPNAIKARYVEIPGFRLMVGGPEFRLQVSVPDRVI